jgi:phosphoglucomutase/phosphomannomutase
MTAGLPTEARADQTRAWLEACERGFGALEVGAEDRATALENLGRWLRDPSFEVYWPQLEWMIEARRYDALLDSFFRVLPFGTGGRRGPVGIGTNRFNAFSLASSVQGHAEFLRHHEPGGDPSVVVVYDVRAYHDLRGVYSSERPNPLAGLTSRDFAMIAAEVYAAMGIRVFLPDEGYLSTPELSLAIRRLSATAGLNISASHNHPDDNGGKFYNRHGAQHVPPNDEVLANLVDAVETIERMPIADARAAGLVASIPPGEHAAYVALNVGQSLAPEARDAHVVFTPLHGTGVNTVAAVLREAGFRVDLVPEESEPDGRFPAVPFRAPNPEVRESMERAMRLARERGADLVMSCDPDADRIGVCARTTDGGWRFLNGNEIACLVAHYKLEKLGALGRLPAQPLVLKTEVTSELLEPITSAFGGTLIGELLVGFKYHGDVLERIENGSYGGGFTLEDFIIGVEESHGVLVTPEIRDKDAAGAAILLAELAAQLKADGQSLVDRLDGIYLAYGYYANRLTSTVMTGAMGLANIRRIQAAIRERPPTELAGRRVERVIDHLDESGSHGAIVSGTDAASRDVLVLRLEGGDRVILRPSGTEPKNKAYVEVRMPALGPDAGAAALAAQKAEGDGRALEIADALTQHMLREIGVDLPRYALRVSGLVSLDDRVDFAERFVPELVKRAQGDPSDAELGAWIDENLAGYGKDARGLTAEAMRAYLDGEREASAGEAPKPALEAIERVFFSG